jgi:glutamate-1-semialdehyde 2,1-aminomutase
MSRYATSEAMFSEAVKVMPGGVNSPVRAFRSVGGTPVFIRSASGAELEDVDGNRYIDFVGSWGPMLLGHAHPEVVAAVQAVAASGLSFGAPTPLETTLCETVRSMVPSMELVRLVNSGTEATMSAIRLARGFTGRPKIVKFSGCYHGHEDSLLVEAGSGVATLGIPGTPGVLPALAAETLTAPYNDVLALEAIFSRYGEEIACCIVEPVAGNMGCILPAEGFLERLRSICTASGALLIFDEVMTGFRVAAGGAQERYGVTPDLTTLGKVIGGGLPVGAYGGRRDIMERVAPSGPIYQAGTLSGNPLSVTSGLTMLRLIQGLPELYTRLDAVSRRVSEGMRDALREAGVEASSASVGGMFGIFFRGEAPRSYAEAKEADAARFNRFFHAMLRRGVYLAPSAFEAGFVSSAHGELELAAVLSASREVFAVLS